MLVPPNVVKQLHSAWMNERWAPELLEYAQDTLKRVESKWLEQVRLQNLYTTDANSFKEGGHVQT
jgi:hypothetical protein